MSDYLFSKNNAVENYPNDHVRDYGLRDKTDASSGLSQVNPNTVQIGLTEYTLTGDSRDCIGTQSLADAQTVANIIGIRDSAFGTVLNVTGKGVPIVVTFNSIANLKNGDTVIFQGIQGNTNTNGLVTISSLTSVPTTAYPNSGTASIQGIGNGNYTGGGNWTRPADSGYPTLNSKMSIIQGNQMVINMPKPLREIRTFSIYTVVMPRDIIPLQYYMSDFIQVSTSLTNTTYTNLTVTDYTTFIPQEAEYLTSRLVGFYSTPLDCFRSYIHGSMAMPDNVTPPPLLLWNPPVGNTIPVMGNGVWPNQPVPYPYQTVPTYQTNSFEVLGQTGLFYLILSGYGIYDLVDWSLLGTMPISNAITTSIMRKLLLILIVQKQSYRNIDYVTLIINSNTVSPNNYNYPYGFGVYQRFIPGNGLAQKYQPGTNPIFTHNPTISSLDLTPADYDNPANYPQENNDYPIAFPNFRGNVNGPYSAPGDRFQRTGLVTVVQDLYLNGDLANLFGNPIVLDDVPVEGIPTHVTFGLNFLSLIEMNLGNIQDSTNENILNAMRIVPNGFGAANIRANGSGFYYQSIYNPTNPQNINLGAGGIGPSSLGPPSAWVNHGESTVGGSFSDPIAKGPNAPDLSPDNSNASQTGTSTPIYRASYYDLGPEVGSFVAKTQKYIDYAINDIPNTDLVVKIEEVDNGIFNQSTNSSNGSAMLDLSVRLDLSSTSGTIKYIDSVQVNGAYATHRFMVPCARMEKLHLTFFTYDGQPIPIETMLQERRSVELSRLTNIIINELGIANPFNIPYLFDPLDPRLIGRVKCYIQFVFKINCYEGIAPGLLPSTYNGIPPYVQESGEVVPFS